MAGPRPGSRHRNARPHAGRLATLVALIASAAALAGPELGGPPVAPERAWAGDAPSRLQVTGTEFDLLLSRARVDPGDGIVQFVNSGEDPHDLKLRRTGGAREYATGVVLPGDYANLPVRFRRSSGYRLWCSLDEHEARGMAATVRVRRR